MGQCCGPQLDSTSKEINQKMMEENRVEMRTNKLLFLGPGGSGKSTIFKQLQYLHNNGFSEDDAKLLRENIYCQITQNMKRAIKHYVLTPSSKEETKEEHKASGSAPTSSSSSPVSPAGASHEDDASLYKGDDEQMRAAISVVMKHSDFTQFDEELSNAITYVWQKGQSEGFLDHAFDENISDPTKVLDATTAYFWDELERIKDPNYVPNEQDIIKVRYRTTGVIEKRFEIKGDKFHIFDVGGQKSERKKWINCFMDVKAVIFVTNMACFNERMYEDHNKNCMEDGLELFGATINDKHFENTHIILFLNKRDLFQEKIAKIPITECPAFVDFPDFEYRAAANADPEPSDPHSYPQTAAFIRHKFESLNRKPHKKQVYTHFTCGLMRSNIDNVFSDVKHIVISGNLMAAGMGIAPPPR